MGNTKRRIVEYVAKYLTCQQVKAEHQKPREDASAITHPKMEVGTHYHGLFNGLTKNINGYDGVLVILDCLKR